MVTVPAPGFWPIWFPEGDTSISLTVQLPLERSSVMVVWPWKSIQSEHPPPRTVVANEVVPLTTVYENGSPVAELADDLQILKRDTTVSTSSVQSLFAITCPLTL